ncbi:hypothetical protein C1646_775381 [Rhizophagus diaphanus]|nr:hypothetical protein C1646_775381 [Rhizophagus diaphanus] [Rhizophagus sp. MUCL 43196]
MSSPASSPASLASITEEISTRIISDVVKDFNTEELIEYLRRKNLKLNKDDIKILRKEKIAGSDFLKLTKEDFRSINFVLGQLGPTTRLTEFIEVFEEINDEDKALNHCMENIILKLSNVKIMTAANEMTHLFQKDVSSEDTTGQIDYVIKSLEDLLCITEGKPRNIKIGYAQFNVKLVFTKHNYLMNA